MESYFFLFILLFLSAMFSGLTLGMMSLTPTELERKIKLGDKDAEKIMKVRKNGSLLLCSLLIGNTAVNSAVAVFMSSITDGVVAGIASTILIVVFGEILPQAIFSRHALKYGSKMVWLVKAIMFIMYPFAKPIAMRIDKSLGKELPVRWDKKEIAEIIKHHEGPSIDSDESRIILGALSYSDKRAKDVMTPGTVVFALDQNKIIDDNLLEKIREEGYSRIPVFNNVKDHIIGILYAKRLIGNKSSGKSVGDMCEKGHILSYRDDTKLDLILNNLLKTNNHMSFVFDEYGTMKGIVTMEDVVEEILKTEILDESDDVPDLQKVAREKAKNYLENNDNK